MGSRIEAACLCFLALLFAVLAAVFLLLPSVLLDPIGMSLTSPAIGAEIRAAYAGFFAASAYVFASGAAVPARRSWALGFGVIVLGGFVLGRLVSWALDGPPVNPVAIANLAAEATGLVVMTGLAVWHRRRAQRTMPG